MPIQDFIIKKAVKTILTYLLNITLYGIVLPILVYGLASIAVVLSCTYYWGDEFMQGDSGFKLGAWMFYYSITLTLYYYFFALISFGFDHKLRKVSIALIVLMPIVFHYLLSAYDYRITVCFAGFHLTYYVLFYVFVWVQKVVTKRIKNYQKLKTLKNTLQILVFILFFSSCGTTGKQTYSWQGKQVSKRKYDKLLQKHTIEFIKNYPKKDDLEIFENLEIIYDTAQLPSHSFSNTR